MAPKTSLLGNVQKAFKKIQEDFIEKVDCGLINKVNIAQEKRYVAFLSIGNPTMRARVFKGTSSNLTNLFNNFSSKTIDLMRKRNVDPQWIKVDFVQNINELPFESLEVQLKKTRKNYFRSGISFDPTFQLAFLEQEINGNAMVKRVNKSPLELNEKNINRYLTATGRNHFLFIKAKYRSKMVYTFTTIGSFADIQQDKIFDLYNGPLTNGIRKTPNIEHETEELIQKSTYFLVNQLKDDGKFHYGYFASYSRSINTYNILRHSSTLYSMVEGYEMIQDPTIIQAVKKGLDYLIREAIVYRVNKDEKNAYVVDFANHNEIKLGACATAILAMTKYMEITNTDTYLEISQALARGILEMKTADDGFNHVYTYPDYTLKDTHRIIYYDGEAVLALLRLYALDKNEQWLSEAKKSFNYFIANDYWKNHDHWLSYAANEITLYDPQDKYFLFGLQNCYDRLDFIYQRETTYPTFLELIMATYKMIKTIKQLNKEYLLESFDVDFLQETTDRRAAYQRVGFFYPEMAMYTKKPSIILHGFFMRHHSFRVRIDDVEHYISGYWQYLQYRIPDLAEKNIKINDL